MKTGRIYLSIVQSFREKGSKYPKAITVKSLGYLDELEKLHDDPIAFCNQEIARLNDENLKDNAPLAFTIGREERLDPTNPSRKNFGYAVLSHIYHELGNDTFLTNRQRHSKEEYDANAIMKLLVFSRLLYPASKKKTYENKERFFEKAKLSTQYFPCLL